MSPPVRSGLVAAKKIAAGVVSISARMAARSEPTSSRTTVSSSHGTPWRQRMGGGGVRSARAAPSNKINRETDASERRNRATPGSPRRRRWSRRRSRPGRVAFAEHLVGDPVLTQPGVPGLRLPLAPTLVACQDSKQSPEVLSQARVLPKLLQDTVVSCAGLVSYCLDMGPSAIARASHRTGTSCTDHLPVRHKRPPHRHPTTTQKLPTRCAAAGRRPHRSGRPSRRPDGLSG